MEMFRKRGYQVVYFKNPADIYIINTCTVTHTADQKSRQMIRRAISQQPDAVVAVVGCYSQVAPDDILSIPGVDLVVGTRGRARLVELAEEILEKKRAGESAKGFNAVQSLEEELGFEQLPFPDNPQRTRAFLKIQDGCDQYCAYCIIPYARGGVRSLLDNKLELSAFRDSLYKHQAQWGFHLFSMLFQHPHINRHPFCFCNLRQILSALFIPQQNLLTRVKLQYTQDLFCISAGKGKVAGFTRHSRQIKSMQLVSPSVSNLNLYISKPTFYTHLPFA
jgi:hypothetical protein